MKSTKEQANDFEYYFETLREKLQSFQVSVSEDLSLDKILRDNLTSKTVNLLKAMFDLDKKVEELKK